jgi:GR25 family glycosyltransferase involved in LPS biosynthesis
MEYPLPAFYINLDRRKDRREEFMKEAELLGFPVERFPAIARTPGILGCGLSHLAVLKLARERKLPAVLIFEDDFQLLVSPEEFRRQITTVLEQEASWDVLMLSYNLNAFVPHSPHLLKVLDCQTASGYIVHSRFYDTLINLYETAMPALEKTGRHWDYANDQVWKQLQPKAAWYAFKTRLGKQRPSFSDNSGSHTDYGI